MSYLNNPKYWRDRAEKTRAIAEQCWNDEEKQRMLRIAHEYERLAEVAEERLRPDAAFAKGEQGSVPQPSPRT